MKLAFAIFKYYPYGGLQRDCLKVAECFATQGHEVHLFTMQWQGPKPLNITIYILPTKGLSNHKRAVNFAKAFKDKLTHYDAVIGFDRMPNLDYYFAGDLCFVSTASKKHGFWFKLSARYRYYKYLEGSVFSKSSQTKVFVLTDEVKKSYQAVYHTQDERFYLIPPGIEKLCFTQEALRYEKALLKKALALKENVVYCLQVGSDFKRKGVDRSLHALGSLPKESNVHLLVIGRGNVQYYKALAKKLEVDSRVTFLGVKDNVSDYMKACDLLLHPAYFETAGMVLVEALTHGLPVLVSGQCGYAYHIAAAKAGKVLSSPFCQEAMNHALHELLVSKPLQNYSQNALAYAENTDLYGMSESIFNTIKNP